MSPITCVITFYSFALQREKITDYGYFTVRHLQHKRSNIIHNAFNTLKANEPRRIRSINRNTKRQLAIRLGYVKPKRLTPEEKAAEAKKKMLRMQSIRAKNKKLYKERKERIALRRENRKTRLAKRAAEGTLKKREKVDQSKIKRQKKRPGKKLINREKVRRQHIDASRKKKAAYRQKKYKEIIARITARKAKKAAAKS